MYYVYKYTHKHVYVFLKIYVFVCKHLLNTLINTYFSLIYTCLCVFIYLYICNIFVSNPAAIALAIQMYSFCHANKAHLN